MRDDDENEAGNVGEGRNIDCRRLCTTGWMVEDKRSMMQDVKRPEVTK
jgi:hypothetical protein